MQRTTAVTTESGKSLRKTKSGVFLFLLLAAFVIKSIFVGSDVDEGYGVILGYRLAAGDRLIRDMWEPHQTSAIFTALLIKPFLLARSGDVTYLYLYLRGMFFLIQTGITIFFCKTLKKLYPALSKESLFLLGSFFFFSTPKHIYLPEYSVLCVWFSTLFILCMIRMCCLSQGRKRLLWSAGAGASLVCAVLTYPSMVILLPAALILIGRMQAEPGEKIKSCATIGAICFAAFCAFMAYLFHYLSVSELTFAIPHILSDGSHAGGVGQKLLTEAVGFGKIIFWMIVSGALGWLLHSIIGVLFVQVIVQLFFCFAAKEPVYNYQLVYLTACIMGIAAFNAKKEKNPAILWSVVLSFSVYLGVCLLSNWGPECLLVYLVPGAVCSLGGILAESQEKKGAENQEEVQERAGKNGRLLLTFLIAAGLISRIYVCIDGTSPYSTLWEVRGYSHEGARAFVFSSYMNAYRYNVTLQDWKEAVPEGSKVLYVGTSQYYYLMGDCSIASPSTISTPTYDEALLEYWEKYPEKYPDVVLVESWFGEIPDYEEDSFIRKWLDTQYHASQVRDYSYIRVYTR